MVTLLNKETTAGLLSLYDHIKQTWKQRWKHTWWTCTLSDNAFFHLWWQGLKGVKMMEMNVVNKISIVTQKIWFIKKTVCENIWDWRWKQLGL